MSDTPESLRAAVALAQELAYKVEVGTYSSEARETAAIEEARGLYNQVLNADSAEGEVLADALHGLGHLVRVLDEDVTTAEPLLLRAAELRASLGDMGGHLAALVDLGEARPMHPAVDQGVMAAVAAGLPPDLDVDADPMHLVIAKREAREPEAAVKLAEALFHEALGRGDRARAARLQIEIGKVEDARKQRKAARQCFEAALELAEGDNEQTLRALLHLIDAWWSTGNAAKARELFARAEKIRGVPQSLLQLRKITGMALR